MAKQRNAPKRNLQIVEPGGPITIMPGISVAYSFTGITLDDDWKEVMFVVKTNILTTEDPPDILVVASNPQRASDGLRFIDRREVDLSGPTINDASIGVTRGAIDVFVSATSTALFSIARPNARYMIKQRIDGDVLDVRLVATGKANIKVL